jgi:hypothetical protein
VHLLVTKTSIIIKMRGTYVKILLTPKLFKISSRHIPKFQLTYNEVFIFIRIHFYYCFLSSRFLRNLLQYFAYFHVSYIYIRYFNKHCDIILQKDQEE